MFRSHQVLVWTGGDPEPVPGPNVEQFKSLPFPKSFEAAEVTSATRTAVILAFCDSGNERRGGWPPDSLQQRDWQNVEFFIRQVVGGQRSQNMDFVFVDTAPGRPAVLFQELPANVRYVHRDNVGFDMCSYKIGLALLDPAQYNYVVLMNGSVRGPFSTALDFLEPFKERVKARDTPVVGTTVSCGDNQPHIQSMFYLANSLGTKLLNATLSCDVPNKHEATWGPHGEISLSQNLLAAGYNFAVLQGYWQGHDFRDRNSSTEKCKHINDPYYPMADRDPVTLKRRDLDAEDMIFFKANRAVNEGRLEFLTRKFNAMCGFTEGRKVSPSDLEPVACGTWMVQRNQTRTGYLVPVAVVSLVTLAVARVFPWRLTRFRCCYKSHQSNV